LREKFSSSAFDDKTQAWVADKVTNRHYTGLLFEDAAKELHAPFVLRNRNEIDTFFLKRRPDRGIGLGAADRHLQKKQTRFTVTATVKRVL
jgi:hypothetical protein